MIQKKGILITEVIFSFSSFKVFATPPAVYVTRLKAHIQYGCVRVLVEVISGADVYLGYRNVANLLSDALFRIHQFVHCSI